AGCRLTGAIWKEIPTAQQSSEGAAPPDNRLHKGAPAAAVASSSSSNVPVELNFRLPVDLQGGAGARAVAARNAALPIRDSSHDRNFVGGELYGPGTLTYNDGGMIKGTFVDGYIDAGMAEKVKCDDVRDC
ncbi:hypothetical protein THAOC_26776, partial [Thalassiosira oceanica]